MQERLFFSNKNKLDQKTLPPMFGDHFPLSSIHEQTGTLFSQSSRCAGLLIDLPAQKGTPGLAKILHTWTRATDYSSIDCAVNISFYKKRYGTEGAARSLLSITVSRSGPSAPEKMKSGKKKRLRDLIFPGGTESRSLQDAAKICHDIREEILFILSERGIDAVAPRDGINLLSLVRFFWTAEPTLVGAEVEDLNALHSYFSRDFYICQDRSFWKEKDRVRMLFNLRRAPGQSIESLHQDLMDSTSLLSGTLVISLATGGRELFSESEEGEKRRNTLLTNTLYYATLPWAKSVGDGYGTSDQWKAAAQTEHKIVLNLHEASRGADWHLHDMTWTGGLYASVPGLVRLDRTAVRDIFDCQII